MKKRATLTIDPELHMRAKALARRRRTTVSGLFERYLRSETPEEKSIIDGMIGSGALRQEFGPHDPLRERLRAKYLR